MEYHTIKEIEEIVYRSKTKRIERVEKENNCIVIYIQNKKKYPLNALTIEIKNF